MPVPTQDRHALTRPAFSELLCGRAQLARIIFEGLVRDGREATDFDLRREVSRVLLKVERLGPASKCEADCAIQLCKSGWIGAGNQVDERILVLEARRRCRQFRQGFAGWG